MGRPIRGKDIGLKVLYESQPETSNGGSRAVDVVAIHGIGAHPDDTWTRSIEAGTGSGYVHWLADHDMLPTYLPYARVMRYGYESAWFGEEAISTRATIISRRLLNALKRERKNCQERPLLFIAHCFGGLVLLKALLDARDDAAEFPELLDSVIGICFFGTPFRGAGGMNIVEMLEAARVQCDAVQVHHDILDILHPGNEFLQDLVDRFSKMRSSRMHNCKIACFFELKASDVGQLLKQPKNMKFVVDESSGCLDRSKSTEKYSMSRNHFEMNKFASVEEEDFQTVKDVIVEFAERGSMSVAERAVPRTHDWSEDNPWAL